MQQAQLRACRCAYGHMVHRRLRDCLYMYLRIAVRARGVVLAMRCVCATGVLLPPYNLLGMDT